mmetsp:Transcript_4924/g.14955  ORF Transcript_4924/g.14955 Transcript_4924/m.14955 type:complete len:290 (-) Transcript_4924:1556-2425(-)
MRQPGASPARGASFGRVEHAHERGGASAAARLAAPLCVRGCRRRLHVPAAASVFWVLVAHQAAQPGGGRQRRRRQLDRRRLSWLLCRQLGRRSAGLWRRPRDRGGAQPAWRAPPGQSAAPRPGCASSQHVHGGSRPFQRRLEAARQLGSKSSHRWDRGLRPKRRRGGGAGGVRRAARRSAVRPQQAAQPDELCVEVPPRALAPGCGSFNVRVPRSDCPQAEPAVFALLAGWAGAAVRSLAARFCWLRRGARRADPAFEPPRRSAGQYHRGTLAATCAGGAARVRRADSC